MYGEHNPYATLSRRQVALFERNPVCALCYRICMDMCEEYGGINFDLLDSIRTADDLCGQIIQNVWSLDGVEHYFDMVNNRLGHSKPAIACTFATVCVTLTCMDNLPEPVYQLAHDMRGLIIGEGNDLYDSLRQSAYRQDIVIDATTYGEPPPKPNEHLYIEHLESRTCLLEQEISYLKTQSKTMETSEAKTIINVQGDYIAEQNNDIHDCTIYASGISPVVNKESISESSSGAKEFSSKNSYPFVVYSRLAELGTYTAEEFEAAYRQAAAQGAPKFAKFLKHYSGLGIFDFDGNEKKQIFEILKAFFPSEIKYGYTNFTVYF